MNGLACPKCGGPVHVDCGGEGTCCHVCPKCGPVDPVTAMVKVFPGGGALLGGKVEE